MDLMGTLGLDNVDDPDNLPDGKYAGVIFKCEYLVSKTDKLGIAITYKCTDPQSKFNGREKFEWWTIGDNPTKNEEGEYQVAKATMSESQKPYFKKRMAAIGIPESRLASLKQADLNGRVGTEIYFGIKNKDGYNNVNFVEMRGASVGDAGSVDPFESGYLKEQPSTAPATTPTGSNLADNI